MLNTLIQVLYRKTITATDFINEKDSIDPQIHLQKRLTEFSSQALAEAWKSPEAFISFIDENTLSFNEIVALGKIHSQIESILSSSKHSNVIWSMLIRRDFKELLKLESTSKHIPIPINCSTQTLKEFYRTLHRIIKLKNDINTLIDFRASKIYSNGFFSIYFDWLETKDQNAMKSLEEWSSIDFPRNIDSLSSQERNVLCVVSGIVRNDNKNSLSRKIAIIDAANTMKVEMLKLMIADKDVNPNIECENGYVPLHGSPWFLNDEEMTRVLLSHPKININFIDKYSRSVIYKAVSYRRPGTIRLLLTRPDLHLESGGYFLVKYAIIDNAIDCLDILLKDARVDVNRKSEDNILSFAKKLETLRFLLGFDRIDPNKRNQDGSTVLIRALENDNFEYSIEILYKPGVNVFLKDKNGNTALTIATKKNRQDVVELIEEVIAANEYQKPTETYQPCYVMRKTNSLISNNIMISNVSSHESYRFNNV